VIHPGHLAAALAHQVESNRSNVGAADCFAAHRTRLTREIVERAPPDGRGRLCLLGAGNAHDVELDALAARFAEIHLVDIDAEAVGNALSRVSAAARPRFTAHAPLDASGLFDRLEGWSRAPPDATQSNDIVAGAVARVLAALPGRFDVVVSCCLLTQLQLVLLQVLGDVNPRFDELRTALNRAHVRTLGGLLVPGGVALLVTDVTSDAIFPPLRYVDASVDLGKLMGDLITAGHVIHVAHPGLLSSELRRDPELKQAYAVRFPVGPWIWLNGPDQTMLVYGLEITARTEVGVPGPV
jgi:hypothetical protein